MEAFTAYNTAISCSQNVHRSSGFKELMWQLQTPWNRMLQYFCSTTQVGKRKEKKNPVT
jgi:hypothetical protein